MIFAQTLSPWHARTSIVKFCQRHSPIMLFSRGSSQRGCNEKGCQIAAYSVHPKLTGRSHRDVCLLFHPVCRR